MPRKDFIPDGDNDFLAWHDNFKTQAVATGVANGLSAADVTAITAHNTDLHAKFPANVTAKAAAKTAADNKNISRLTADKFARLCAGRMKKANTYSPSIGDTYGINGPEDTTDMSTAAPVLTGTALPGAQGKIDFGPKLKSDGCAIYGKRGTEPGFTLLALDTQTPYIDNRPLLVTNTPELREYKARYFKNGEELGNWSGEIVINCAP
jgi:hypothetical protein